MALQMPVYREISSIESKVFLGLSWRQLLAAVVLAVVCGGGYLLLWIVAGLPSDLCMYLVFPPGIPIAMWGWWRPRGLMPERYARYLWRHYAHRNVYLLDGPSRRFVTPARPSLKE
ncbi:PrgI family protein [Bifidobacterium tissieri]|uniref:PrgI family protein n=1 Tax=Bifidobacterium tissieri TaxID=1630162 RepID=A0A261FJX0_9BIFI|nr:PrgI family protein [Bifidobacterium tissieri]OZG59325.1 PrgI family protein [Bifidobacterium tissieri]